MTMFLLLICAALAAIAIWLAIRHLRKRQFCLQQIGLLRSRKNALLNTISEPLWFKDADGRYVVANPALFRLLNRSEQELLGRTDRELYPAEVAEQYQAQDAEARASGQPGRFETCWEQDQQQRCYETVLTPVFDANQRYLGLVGMARDTTERARSLRQLEHYRERLSLALHAGRFGVWDWDVQANRLLWDDALYAIYGVRREDFAGAYEAWEATVLPEDLQHTNAEVQACLRGEKDFNTTFRVRWPDGSIRILRGVGEVIRAADGQPLRLIGMNWDVTEEHAMRLALQESESRYRGLFENSRDGIAHFATDGRFIEVNQALCELLGYAREELLQRTYADITPEAWREQDQRVLEELIRCGYTDTFEKEYRCKDGSTVLVSLRAWTMVDALGNLTGYWSIVQDIRERKQAEDQLRKLANLQRNILDGTNFAIIATDCNGLITSFNRGAEHLLGYRAEEMIGRQTPEILHDRNEVAAYAAELSEELGCAVQPGFDAFVARSRLKHVPDEREWTYRRKDGTCFRVRLTVTPLLDADGAIFGYLGIARDLTDRLLMQQALQRSEASLRRAQAVARLGSWQLDLRQGVLEWSEETYRIFGVTSDAPLSYAQFLDCVHPDDRALVDAAWQAALGGAPYDIEHRIVVAGEVRWLHEKAELVYEDGQAVSGIGTVQDITLRKEIEQEQRRLIEIIESSPDIVSQCDLQGRLTYMNLAGRLILAWREQDQPEHFTVADMHAPDVGARILQEYLPQVVAYGSKVFDTTFRTRDGRDIPVSQLILAHRDETGEITHYSTVARDMSEQSWLMRRLFLADKVFTFTDEAILITDANNRIVMVNQAFTRLTGYSEDEVLDQNPRLLSSGRHGPEFYREMWATLLAHGNWQGEVWDRRKDGVVYPKWMNINAIHDPRSGAVTNYVAVFTDISERKAQEEKIRHIAFHDALTSLPNRLLFRDRLDQAMAEARRSDGKIALMFLDLDRFKDINDTLGHHVGDQLLRELACRLYGCVRESDTVARLGGDEFVVLLSRLTDVRDPATVAEKILEVVAEPLRLEGNELVVGTSIGIAIYPDDAQAAEDLMKSADAALYHAKDRGRGNYQFFTAELNRSAHERMRIEHALRYAVERNELELYYQPKVDVRSNRVVGCEALLRWHHPEWGMVSPATFIPVAEATGLILPIGEWVLRESLRQAAAWGRAGYPTRISINLSPRQFQDPALVTKLAAFLADSGVAPAECVLEITESTLMHNLGSAADTLRQIKALGAMISIDDFGTGYSSLAYLKTFQIDKLKVDQSFVRDIETDPNDAAIVRAVVSLSHELGLEVVAEGVENAQQLRFLTELGCDIVQGYHYSRPLPAPAYLDYLRAWPGSQDA